MLLLCFWHFCCVMVAKNTPIILFFIITQPITPYPGVMADLGFVWFVINPRVFPILPPPPLFHKLFIFPPPPPQMQQHTFWSGPETCLRPSTALKLPWWKPCGGGGVLLQSIREYFKYFRYRHFLTYLVGRYLPCRPVRAVHSLRWGGYSIAFNFERLRFWNEMSWTELNWVFRPYSEHPHCRLHTPCLRPIRRGASRLG